MAAPTEQTTPPPLPHHPAFTSVQVLLLLVRVRCQLLLQLFESMNGHGLYFGHLRLVLVLQLLQLQLVVVLLLQQQLENSRLQA